MKHSKVFLALLHDIWERAYQQKIESERSDYLNAQTRSANRRGGSFCRRRSDQFVGGRRRGGGGVDATGRGG